MSMNFEKSVKGGTKVKLAAPKTKYVEHLLIATQSGEAGVAEVFRTLTHRLRDSTWTVAFKSLIIVHLMIKEGAEDATLRWLAVAPQNRLAINSFTDVQTQGHNIRLYSEYIIARAKAYAASRCDYVRSGDRRIKGLTVDKGLLRETELVQMQVKALVRCDLLTNDVENEISLMAFRLLTKDLLDLYHVENEAVMNVLSHYFEMSKPDAERAIHIYKNFCKQTDLVVKYLGIARQYEHATRLEIPKIKHAPTSLANSLQEYVDDKDFEVNRRQYLAEQEAKRTGRPAPKKPATTQAQAAPRATPAETSQRAAEIMAPGGPPPAKGPAPDLIDFFESIEQNQQPMAQNTAQPFQQQATGFPQMQGQATGFAPQQQQFGGAMPQQVQQTGMNGLGGAAVSTNPFQQMQQQQAQQQQQPPQPLQTQFTGAGFGGYGPQPQQQAFAPADAFSPQQTQSPAQMQLQQPFQPPQAIVPQQTGSTNPFRQSTMPTGAEGAFGGATFQPQQHALQRQSTNPFARHASPAQQQTAFAPIPENAAPPMPPMPTPLQSQPTGTNPFARASPASAQQTGASSLSPIQIQPTGSTNPFRQSAFVNQATGTGWQNSGPQTTIGGWNNVETIPVFPRPNVTAQQTQQQTAGQSPWG